MCSSNDVDDLWIALNIIENDEHLTYEKLKPITYDTQDLVRILFNSRIICTNVGLFNSKFNKLSLLDLKKIISKIEFCLNKIYNAGFILKNANNV